MCIELAFGSVLEALSSLLARNLCYPLDAILPEAAIQGNKCKRMAQSVYVSHGVQHFK